MKTAFVLQHEYEWYGRDEVKFIGVYSTRDEAESAAQRVRLQPGFCDWPDGFCIDEYELDKDHWTEGFSKRVNVLIKTDCSNAPYVVASCLWQPGDLYKICSMDTPDAKPEFSIGQTIRCSEQCVDGSPSLVAEELAEKGI